MMMPMAAAADAATAGAGATLSGAAVLTAGNGLGLASGIQGPLVDGFADFRRRSVRAVRFARCGRGGTGTVITDRLQSVPLLKVCHLTMKLKCPAKAMKYGYPSFLTTDLVSFTGVSSPVRVFDQRNHTTNEFSTSNCLSRMLHRGSFFAQLSAWTERSIMWSPLSNFMITVHTQNSIILASFGSFPITVRRLIRSMPIDDASSTFYCNPL